MAILNAAAAAGLKPGDPSWPVVALESWGREEEATGVSRAPPLRIIGAVVLRARMVGIDGREATQLFRAKVFALGNCGWDGLIVGGPALEQAPVGVGFRPTLAGHVFEALGLVLPRVEQCDVQTRLDQHALLLEQEPPRPPVATAGPEQCMLSELAELAEAELGEVLNPADFSCETRAVLLDADEVVLGDGEAAWIPVAIAAGGQAPEGMWMGSHRAARVRAGEGPWSGNGGVALVFNIDQPEVRLRRGDVVALLAPRRPEAPGSEACKPDFAHIVIDDVALECTLELELPPEE